MQFLRFLEELPYLAQWCDDCGACCIRLWVLITTLAVAMTREKNDTNDLRVVRHSGKIEESARCRVSSD